MKILLMSIGTRGDIDPFLAIGKLFEKRGHEVHYAFPIQFEHLVDNDASFDDLSKEFLELLDGTDARNVMGRSTSIQKIWSLIKLYKKGRTITKTVVAEQESIIKRFQPDVIIHHPKCNYPTIWSLTGAGSSILVSPVPNFLHYFPGHSHVGFKKDWGSLMNKLTYKLSQLGLVKSTRDAQKFADLPAHFSRAGIKNHLMSTPVIYAVSRSLFQRPENWGNHLQVLGQRARNTAKLTPLPDDLLSFLDRVQKPIFISFGSMKGNKVTTTSRQILSTLTALKIPAVVNTSFGGIAAVDDYHQSQNLYFTDEVAYELIFPKVHAVIHHGGAGTTHQGLRYGKPTLIIPHAMDQYSWNKLIFKLGAGPLGPSITKINKNNLRNAISDLYRNPVYEQNAKKLSIQMQAEDLDDELYDFVCHHAGKGTRS